MSKRSSDIAMALRGLVSTGYLVGLALWLTISWLARMTYLYGGVGYIHHQIIVREQDKTLQRPSGFLWVLVGAYTALYGIASARYEASANRLYTKRQLHRAHGRR